jgi:hypothetical protein
MVSEEEAAFQSLRRDFRKRNIRVYFVAPPNRTLPEALSPRRI